MLRYKTLVPEYYPALIQVSIFYNNETVLSYWWFPVRNKRFLLLRFGLIMGIVGGLVTILLSIIAYFIIGSHNSSKETTKQVTNISEYIAVSAEHFRGFETQCNFKHEIIDGKIKNHEQRIVKLEEIK